MLTSLFNATIQVSSKTPSILARIFRSIKSRKDFMLSKLRSAPALTVDLPERKVLSKNEFTRIAPDFIGVSRHRKRHIARYVTGAITLKMQ